MLPESEEPSAAYVTRDSANFTFLCTLSDESSCINAGSSWSCYICSCFACFIEFRISSSLSYALSIGVWQFKQLGLAKNLRRVADFGVERVCLLVIARHQHGAEFERFQIFSKTLFFWAQTQNQTYLAV